MNKAILIFGPAGSGKTSTVKRIAENEGWTYISEDEYWNEIKKGKAPEESLRTHEEQKIIWKQVLEDILHEFSNGNNVALEFLVYEDPPRPLIFYKKHLLEMGVEVYVKILKPSYEVMLNRRRQRNLAHDKLFFKNRENGEKNRDYLQYEVLSSDFIDKNWIIEDKGSSIETIYKKHFAEIVED